MTLYPISIINHSMNDNRIPIFMGILIILLVIFDLLMTRQLISYTNESGTLLFILTTFIGYGIGPFLLLAFAHSNSKELRMKSRIANIIHWSVIFVQILLFSILIIILAIGNPDYYLSRFVFASSSIFATLIMGIMTVKFFTWYKLSRYKNPIVLFYGLAAITLGLSIIEDATTKLMLVEIIYEPSPVNLPDGSNFLYETSEKYDGQIVFQNITNNIVTLFIIPNSNLELYNLLNSIVLPIGFAFRWLASSMLLSNIYKKIHNLPVSFWIILSLPLVFYLIGKMPGFFSGESLAGVDEEYRYFFRVLFRIGTIAGNILFGLAFFMVARKLKSSKLRNYLIMAGLGDTIVGISLSTSAIEPTFGMAGHSLVLLSTYLFALGLQASAISISQDLKLRQTIRDSAIEQSKLLVSIGSAQLVKEIENKVLLDVEKMKGELEKESGIASNFTELETRHYLAIVLKDIKIIKNIDDIINTSRRILDQSHTLVVCSVLSGLRLAFNNYFDKYEEIMFKNKVHEHNGIKVVTCLNDKNDIKLIKKLLEIGIDIRHVKNMPPINFTASDNGMIATIQKSESGQLIHNLLTTNEPAYIQHFKSIFDNLWNNGIDIKQKIDEFDQGIDNQGIEIIQNYDVLEKMIFDLIQSSKIEVVGIFSTSRAFHRQEYTGSIKFLKEHVEKTGIKVRILVPHDEQIKNLIENLNSSNLSDNIKIRIIEPRMQTKVSIMVIDRMHSLTVEVKDDSKQTTKEAMGFATYSNSTSTVLSYYAIFESLWNQVELYEKLQIAERMHNEFINIAAHELRTPIQPILSASEILNKNLTDDKDRGLITLINRNAKRLKKLSEDILDVTKIEGYSMHLFKEKFRLIDIVAENVNNYRNSQDNKSIKFEYNIEEDVILYADRNGISRVIANMISNSIKFIPRVGGIITISANTQKFYHKGYPSHKIIVIKIKDNGRGIDKDVFPKLFTKFSSKSFHGIGLGLYISKNIIAAHGGKIWAENNIDGVGATFSFSILTDFKDENDKQLE